MVQTWYAFRSKARIYFGFGSEHVAQNFLRYLNREQGTDRFVIGFAHDLYPTPSLDELQRSPERVDMKAEMKGWRG